MAARPKILITRRLTEAVETRARRDYNVVWNEDSHQLSGDEIIAMSAGADAIVGCITDRYTAAVIERLPVSVKIISAFSVGTDHIDLAAARTRGIRVANAPDAVTIATAEIAMLLILGAARRVGEGERLLRAKEWRGWHPLFMLGHRLDGKRLGIFGMGQIGQALAKRARAFDMIVHYHNRTRLTPEKELGAVYHDSFESLLSVSDVLSINAPATPATRHILNAAAIARLPRGAIVVNTARGDLVNDEDLVAALKSGHAGYAGLDVFQGEPSINPGYYDLPNALLLPHMGTSAVEARDEMGFAALDNVDAVLAGREPVFPVV
jgi:lactate dehydrogenase-like 2-hydroxyacid dehydrogenase